MVKGKSEVIMKKHIFISHSSANSEIANELCAYLENKAKNCFIAPRDIRSGHEYAEEILDGIDNSYVMVLMLSEKSNTSPHVLREIERAVSRDIPIIVYKIEGVELSKSLEYFLMTHQWMDARDDGDFKRILESINSFDSGDKKGKAITGINDTDSIQNTEHIKNVHKNKKMVVTLSLVALLVIVLTVTLTILIGGKENIKTGGNQTTETENIKKGDNQTAETEGRDVNSDIKPGETVVLGLYNEEPISWSVLRVNEDGTAVLVADNILTFKAYDGAESGKAYEYDGKIYLGGNVDYDNYELLVQTMGSNSWSSSNIRTWLNSDSKVVEYTDSMPISKAMADGKNGYNTESGFLYGFSEEEKNVIVTVMNSTKEYYFTKDGENFQNEGRETVSEDKVYLLTKNDVNDFAKAGISIYASPTASAVEKDETKYYQQYKDIVYVDEYYWWLREPEEDMPHRCYFVTSGYEQEKFESRAVNVESIGIRPAVTVDIEKLLKLQKEKQID